MLAVLVTRPTTIMQNPLFLSYYILHPFSGPLSQPTRVSWYQKGKTSLDLLEQETVSGSGISWVICKSAPHSRQITMPAPHHSVFYRPDALPAVAFLVVVKTVAGTHCA